MGTGSGSPRASRAGSARLSSGRGQGVLDPAAGIVDDWHGTNAFIRDGDRVFRTYFINARGDEALGSTWSYLDMTALGRQEEWEDSPDGYPQESPYVWWAWHDEASEAGVDRPGLLQLRIKESADRR